MLAYRLNFPFFLSELGLLGTKTRGNISQPRMKRMGNIVPLTPSIIDSFKLL